MSHKIAGMVLSELCGEDEEKRTYGGGSSHSIGKGREGEEHFFEKVVYLSDFWIWNHYAPISHVLRTVLLRGPRPIRQRRRKVRLSPLQIQFRTIHVESEAYLYQGANFFTWY
jgi:hypothetical protein